MVVEVWRLDRLVYVRGVEKGASGFVEEVARDADVMALLPNVTN
jgi:hypothetical protein